MAGIAIKRLMSGEAFEQVVELQKIYWGEDASNLVPRHMFHSLTRHGGHLIGAYEDDQLIGFVMGFMGIDTHIELRHDEPAAARLLIMSKRMLVLPGHRGKSIGFQLKQAQRDIALELGIPLVTWTFDPLLALNAHLNICKLGARIHRFKANYFGLDTPDTLKSDRLIVHWRVCDRRAQDGAAGNTSRVSLAQLFSDGAKVINLADFSGRWPKPVEGADLPDATCFLLEIPSDIDELELHAPELARSWREHIRQVFPIVFQSGCAVTDFVLDEIDGHRRTFYVLEKH